MCVQAELNRCPRCKVPGPSSARSSAIMTFKAPLKNSGASWLGSIEESGLFRILLRDVSRCREAPEVLTFLLDPTAACLCPTPEEP
jgi:hypothetical protein